MYKLEQMYEEQIINKDILNVLEAAGVFEITEKNKERLKAASFDCFMQLDKRELKEDIGFDAVSAGNILTFKNGYNKDTNYLRCLRCVEIEFNRVKVGDVLKTKVKNLLELLVHEPTEQERFPSTEILISKAHGIHLRELSKYIRYGGAV